MCRLVLGWCTWGSNYLLNRFPPDPTFKSHLHPPTTPRGNPCLPFLIMRGWETSIPLTNLLYSFSQCFLHPDIIIFLPFTFLTPFPLVFQTISIEMGLIQVYIGHMQAGSLTPLCDVKFYCINSCKQQAVDMRYLPLTREFREGGGGGITVGERKWTLINWASGIVSFFAFFLSKICLLFLPWLLGR